MTKEDVLSREEANGRTQRMRLGGCQTCRCSARWCMVSPSGLDLLPFRLGDVDLISTDNNDVARGGTTVAEFIESFLEEAAVWSVSDIDCDSGGW